MGLLKLQSTRLREAREAKKVVLTQVVEYGNNPEAPINLDGMENDIYEATYKASIDPEIYLMYYEKIEHDNAWRTYRDRTYRLEKQQRKAFSLVMGQCMQVILDTMKYDTGWDKASISYDSLQVLTFTEKSILDQTEDQYAFATVYK